MFSFTRGQNLVPNSSFEIYDTCPNNQGQVKYCLNWFDPTYSSSDYFNTCCSNNIAGVPYNFFGHKYPYSGNAYMGFVTYNQLIPNYREYISVRTNENLIFNGKYTFSCYISPSSIFKFSTNSLGLLLLDDTLGLNQFFQSPINIATDTILFYNVSDTTKWTKIEIDFLAKRNASFILIGNFFNDSNTAFSIINPAAPEACYTYIDSVSLVKIEPSDLAIPNVFTPNGDGINEFIDFSEFQNCRVSIVNRWGSIVHVMDSQSNFLWFGKDYLGHDLNNGVYYYIIESTFFSKTGSIHLIR